MSNIRTYNITHTLDGTSGDTTTSQIITGRILAVSINYPTNTVTVDLDTVDEPANQKILNRAAANTDIVVYPRVAVEDITGTAVTYDGTNEIYEPFVVNSRLKLSLASGTDTEVVTIAVTVEEN